MWRGRGGGGRMGKEGKDGSVSKYVAYQLSRPTGPEIWRLTIYKMNE